ncbi:MAG: BrnT family toxin [Holosporales bacterium]|jgi:uncharacterized DUF497 family protein
MSAEFEWDDERSRVNFSNHGVTFDEAQGVFFDPHRLITRDDKHSVSEERWYCVGKVDGRILTVRFTYRSGVIRIFGAGTWRKWRKLYEKTFR